MTAALEGVSGQQHAPTELYTRERPGTNLTGDWVGPRAGLERCGKISSTQGFDPRTVEPIAQSLYRLSYAAYICIYILYIKYIIHIIVHIKDLFKPTFLYFLPKTICNIKLPPATVRFAPPQCY